MFTRCPHCETCFRISPEQLKAARGEARCGRCFGTFNSLEHLVEELEETSNPAAEQTTDEEPIRKLSFTQANEFRIERSLELANEIQAHSEPTASQQHFLLWLLSAILLCFALTGQYAYFNIQPLSQQASLRPTLSLLCEFTACEVPLMRAPQHIKLVHRNIRNHPSLKNTLQVKAEMISNADFTQAFPLMELSLQDISGRTLARRRFKPNEYLSDAVNIQQGLSPNHSIQVLLELVDPGKEAVGFEFEFL